MCVGISIPFFSVHSIEANPPHLMFDLFCPFVGGIYTLQQHFDHPSFLRVQLPTHGGCCMRTTTLHIFFRKETHTVVHCRRPCRQSETSVGTCGGRRSPGTSQRFLPPSRPPHSNKTADGSQGCPKRGGAEPLVWRDANTYDSQGCKILRNN